MALSRVFQGYGSILNYFQYRSLDRVYLFKAWPAGSIILKILDISQKCLFKRAFSTEELNSPQLLSHQTLLSPQGLSDKKNLIDIKTDYQGLQILLLNTLDPMSFRY